jgi:hypothetical protein
MLKYRERPTRVAVTIGRWLLLAVLAFSAPMLASCDRLTPAFKPVRYKLQAEVETPAGVKSGYSVIEVTLEKTLGSFRVKGEAAAVDVAPGQTLFVVLRSPNDIDWAAWALNYFPGARSSGPAPLNRDARAAQAERDLDRIRADRAAYPVWLPKDGSWNGPPKTPGSPGAPYLVRFRDIRDPKTVELVDPDNLAKTYGAGFRLKGLTVQITDEPVTHGIKDRLPKYTRESDFDRWYKSLPYGDPRALSFDDFARI